MSAESIRKTAFLGVAWPRDAKPTPPRAAGGTVDQNWAKTLPREAVWSMERVKSDGKTEIPVYNKRGMAEQWIKEGKQAVAMTRLSCHRFRANEVAAVAECYRLQPWQPVAATGAAQGDRQLVADQSSAAARENRWALDKARPLLLAAPGGESSDTAALWRHAGQDRGATVPRRIGGPQGPTDFGDAGGREG